MTRLPLILGTLAALAAFSSSAQAQTNAGADANKAATAPAGNVSGKTGTNSRTPMGIDAQKSNSSMNRQSGQSGSSQNRSTTAPCTAGDASCITPGQRDPDTAISQTPSKPTAPSGDTKTESSDTQTNDTDNDANNNSDGNSED